MIDILKIVRIEQGVKAVRDKPEYQKKPVSLIEDFAEVLQDLRKLMVAYELSITEVDQLKARVKELEEALVYEPY